MIDSFSGGTFMPKQDTEAAWEKYKARLKRLAKKHKAKIEKLGTS